MKAKKLVFKILFSLMAVLAVIFLMVGTGMFLTSQFRSTPPFLDSSGNVLPGSIAEFNDVELGGYKQKVLIRGKNLNNPILLYLHGGPGSSELALFRHFNAELEDQFMVVLWEQRGAGMSYSLFLDDKTMTIDQFVADGQELIDTLLRRFKKQKLYLVGHSWGSVLGIKLAQKVPEKLHAYVGIGQAVSFQEGEAISLQYAISQAKASGNTQALLELESLKNYPDVTGSWLRDVITQRKWLGKFGGVLFGKEGMGSLFSIGGSKEFGLFDFIPFFLGSYYSLTRLWPQIMAAGDFRLTVPELQVPVYFVMGRHDYNVPFELTVDYYDKLVAPKKSQIWFESSAHMPNFEEPKKFNDFMLALISSSN